MIIYVDIDGTICENVNSYYHNSTPIKNNIDKINRLYDDGNTIIYWTARGRTTGVVGFTDDRVKKLKGDTRPINTCDDRLKMLSAIKYIDEVVSFSSDIELTYFIKKYDTDVLVVGSDYIGKNIIGSEYVGDVIYFNRISDYSTTKIINNIYDEKKN